MYNDYNIDLFWESKLPDACIDLDVCYLTLSTLHYDNNLMTRFSVL